MIEAMRDTSERSVGAARRLRGDGAVSCHRSISYRALMFNPMAVGKACVAEVEERPDGMVDG